MSIKEQIIEQLEPLPTPALVQILELIQAFKPIEGTSGTSTPAGASQTESDPLVGLFAGSPDLATESKKILAREIGLPTGKNTCPFCSPQIYHDTRSEVLLENKHCIFISGDESHLEGWGMIIPRQHRETVFDLTTEEWQGTYELLRQVKQSTDSKLKPDGYSIGWNCGKVGGQSVFHAHLHIIPRFADEPYAGRGIRWFMKQDENKRPGLDDKMTR